MPFSHHSHSGQFCAHARNTLREMVQAAIQKGMRVFALTEHMPRDQEQDLYPEEVGAGMTAPYLFATFDAFHHEARSLQREFEAQITILVGMEIEWIRPSYQKLIESLREKYDFDLIVGSIHHVHGIPIDFDARKYADAVQASNKKPHECAADQEQLFEDYFDSQLAMLEVVKPPVVGHFDLIRYLSDQPDRSLKASATVWGKVVRNLELIRSFSGVLEVNTSGLRKGLAEPYPSADVCKAFAEMGGDFVLSDDSHAIEHIGFAYHKAVSFLESLDIPKVAVIGKKEQPGMLSTGPSITEYSLRSLLTEPFFKPDA